MSKKLADYKLSKILKTLEGVEALTSGFSGDDIKALAEIVEVEEYDEGELALEADELNRDILIIAEGAVSVELKLTSDEDSAKSIKKMRDHSVMGEFAFVDGSRRSANIRVIMKSTLLRLPHEELRNLCDGNNALGYKLMCNLASLMSQRLRNANFEIRAHLYF